MSLYATVQNYYNSSILKQDKFISHSSAEWRLSGFSCFLCLEIKVLACHPYWRPWEKLPCSHRCCQNSVLYDHRTEIPRSLLAVSRVDRVLSASGECLHPLSSESLLVSSNVTMAQIFLMLQIPLTSTSECFIPRPLAARESSLLLKIYIIRLPCPPRLK